MIKIEDVQTVTYEYDSMVEMMNHIKTMSDNGFSLIGSNHINLRCVYKKDLP